MYDQNWSFSEALLFAESSLATAGLDGPVGTKPFTMWFVAFFVLLGVPTYAAAIGQCDNFVKPSLYRPEYNS